MVKLLVKEMAVDRREKDEKDEENGEETKRHIQFATQSHKTV